MRVLFFLHLPIPYQGAAWVRLSFFAEYFRLKGHSVSMAGAFSPSTLCKAGISKWNGIMIINIIPIVMVRNIFSLLFNVLSSTLGTLFVLFITRPQVIVISVPPGETALGTYILAKSLRIKIVFDYRDQWEDYILNTKNCGVYKKLFEFVKTRMTGAYLNSDLVVSVTEALVNSLLLRGVKNVKLVSNGADSSVFKPYEKHLERGKLGLNQNDFVFIYSGTIGEYYKLEIAIKALEKIVKKGENMKLLLVGFGPDVEKVLNLSKELSLEHKVCYLGPKNDRTELAQVLSAADVGIIPFDSNLLWKNALPSKALEYFACGLPALGTVYEDSILGKFICENNIGLISDPEKICALAQNMYKLYSDTEYSIEAGKRASSLIHNRFDRNKIAEEFLGLLLEIN